MFLVWWPKGQNNHFHMAVVNTPHQPIPPFALTPCIAIRFQCPGIAAVTCRYYTRTCAYLQKRLSQFCLEAARKTPAASRHPISMDCRSYIWIGPLCFYRIVQLTWFLST
jgi:hypothetical protein